MQCLGDHKISRHCVCCSSKLTFNHAPSALVAQLLQSCSLLSCRKRFFQLTSHRYRTVIINETFPFPVLSQRAIFRASFIVISSEAWKIAGFLYAHFRFQHKRLLMRKKNFAGTCWVHLCFLAAVKVHETVARKLMPPLQPYMLRNRFRRFKKYNPWQICILCCCKMSSLAPFDGRGSWKVSSTLKIRQQTDG